MERTLVVVTCYRDLKPLHIMFRSIKKYLEPANIVIIVNECDDMKWLTWYDRNSHLLNNHHVKIIYRKDLIATELHKYSPSLDGWILQNILKLIVSTIVNTDEYILLDSKNFFIRPTQLQDINRRAGTNVFNEIGWDIGWISAVTSRLSTPLTSLISPDCEILLSSAETPYIINTSYARQLVEHFGGIHIFVRWFLTVSENLFACRVVTPPEDNRHIFVSEFYLYELFCSLELNVKYDDGIKTNSWVLWNKRYGRVPEWPIDQIPESIYVGGIHRDYIHESSKTEIDNIYRHFGLDEV